VPKDLNVRISERRYVSLGLVLFLPKSRMKTAEHNVKLPK